MFIGKLWKGEYPLVVSYWVFGIVGNIVFGIPLLFINQFTSSIGQSILFPIGMGIAVLINVGIWRSAGKYEGLPIWKLLAKIVVILSLAMTAFSFITAVTNFHISSTFKKGVILFSECQLNEVLQANNGLETPIWIASVIPCNELSNKNLIKILGYSQSDIDSKVKVYNGKLDVHTTLLAEVIKAGKFYPVDKYNTVAECKLSELKLVKKQTAIPFISNLIDNYCNQYVAANLSMRVGFQLGKAMEDGYTFKEIAEYIEANPLRK